MTTRGKHSTQDGGDANAFTTFSFKAFFCILFRHLNFQKTSDAFKTVRHDQILHFLTDRNKLQTLMQSEYYHRENKPEWWEWTDPKPFLPLVTSWLTPATEISAVEMTLLFSSYTIPFIPWCTWKNNIQLECSHPQYVVNSAIKSQISNRYKHVLDLVHGFISMTTCLYQNLSLSRQWPCVTFACSDLFQVWN